MNQIGTKNSWSFIHRDQMALGRTDNDFSFEQVWVLITKIGAAAHKYGATTMTVESYIRSCFDSFGYSGDVKCTPDTLWLSLTDSESRNNREESISIQNDVDLNKLATLGGIVSRIKTGELGYEQTIKNIEEIDETKPVWGPFSVLVSYIAVAIGLPGLIGGNWLDTLIGPFISIIVYLLVYSSTYWKPLFQPQLPLVASFVASILAAASYSIIPQLNLIVVILSASAIILPGYSISLGIGELVARKWKSGIINFSSGLICMTKMVLGSLLGLNLVSLFLVLPTITNSLPAIDNSWFFLLFPTLMMGLIVVFQTPKRDSFWVLLVSSISFAVYIGANQLVPTFVAAFVSSAISAILANTWSARTQRTSLIVLIPVIVLLVSGTVGFRGLVNIAGGNVALGAEQFSETITVAVSIMLGLLAGNLVKQNPSYL